MAFTPQDDTGLVANANAYISTAEFDAYWSDRNDEASVDIDLAVKEAAIIEATQYIDTRFCFKGLPLNSVVDGQDTQFPRKWLYDARGDLTEGLPKLLKDAAAEYAKRAAASPLYVDPETDDSGGQVILKRERVEGAVEEETRFASGINTGQLKAYPAADRLLREYLDQTGALARA
jgi:hypothetical protein